MAQKKQDCSAFPELQVLCFCCLYEVAPEQKARTTYDNILRLVKDPEVCEPIRFLREREIVHYQRFGETNREDCSKSEHVKYNH
jgi:Mn-containing catalase